ncbi:Alpha-mannosidase 2C1 [Entophlyctis luteolus]|nr:Alpha-mannosidase 2C1 [Entophlyctis luteolus]
MLATPRHAPPLASNLNTLQKHRDITIARLDKFVQRGQFEDVNLNTALMKGRSSATVQLSVYGVPDLRRISFEEAMKGEYKSAQIGQWFGPTLATYWFKVDIVIPKEFEGEEVYFEFDASNEAMIWSVDGQPITGLTGGGGDDKHSDYMLSNCAISGEKHQLYVEMACNERGGIADDRTPSPDMNRSWRLDRADLIVKNKTGQALRLYFMTMMQLVKDTPQEWQINADALYYADQIVNTFRLRDERASLIECHHVCATRGVLGCCNGGCAICAISALKECLEIAVRFFAERKKQGRSLHEITAVGNCHIDTGANEAQGGAVVGETDHVHEVESELHVHSVAGSAVRMGGAAVSDAVQGDAGVQQEGPVPAGGRDVGGDGLQHAERRSALPTVSVRVRGYVVACDTFGYSAQLPQISCLSGMKYFFTQKISWNNINRFPNTTFMWAGLDNSEVLTHFAPADTYVGQCNVSEIVRSVHNNKDKVYSNKSIFLYGNGDGGGGPLAEMIERLDILKEVEGLPATVKNGDPAEFYKELEVSSRDLTRWKGELYFELHRGTYTSHGIIKKYNRSSENVMREVEFLSTLALANPHSKQRNYAYPKAEIDRLWKLVLLNQFHDVLPGSSIKMVYDDAVAYYRDVEASAAKLKQDALGMLLGGLAKAQSTKQGTGVLLLRVEAVC